MTIDRLQNVSPQDLGLEPAEIKLLELVDRPASKGGSGNGDGVATAAELDRFRQTTFRSPSQVLPSEPWLALTLQTLAAANAGVSLRGTAPTVSIRRFSPGTQVTLQGVLEATPASATPRGFKSLPGMRIKLAAPVRVGSERESVFTYVYIQPPTANSAARNAYQAELGERVSVSGTLDTFTVGVAQGRTEQAAGPFAGFKPGASIQPASQAP